MNTIIQQKAGMQIQVHSSGYTPMTWYMSSSYVGPNGNWFPLIETPLINLSSSQTYLFDSRSAGNSGPLPPDGRYVYWENISSSPVGKFLYSPLDDVSSSSLLVANPWNSTTPYTGSPGTNSDNANDATGIFNCQDSFVTSVPYTKFFIAGNWTVNLGIYQQLTGTATGSMIYIYRFLKSPNNASPNYSASLISPTFFSSSVGVGIVSGFGVLILSASCNLPSFNLNNEYLFLQVQAMTAGTMSQNSAYFRPAVTQSFIQSPPSVPIAQVWR